MIHANWKRNHTNTVSFESAEKMHQKTWSQFNQVIVMTGDNKLAIVTDSKTSF